MKAKVIIKYSKSNDTYTVKVDWTWWLYFQGIIETGFKKVEGTKVIWEKQ